MKAVKCPYHNVEPEYRIDIYRPEIVREYVDSTGARQTMVFPQLADHYWFCPECNRERLTGAGQSRSRAKLGVGYYSGTSRKDALAKWNAGLSRLVPAIVRAAVEGKEP